MDNWRRLINLRKLYPMERVADKVPADCQEWGTTSDEDNDAIIGLTYIFS